MATKRVLVLALLFVVLAAVGAWRMGWLATAPIPAPATVTPRPTPAPRFQSAWATEQEWLVDRIARDVVEMAAFAASQPPPPPEAPPVKPEAIRFEDHVFSPRAYASLAREALAGAPVPAPDVPGASREDARVLSALLEPRAAVLVREDESLARRLEAEPRDAAAHERASLLLASFALRDAAGRWTDTRPALTRLAAHLSFARALRGGAEPGRAGRFAEAALVTLLGRERDALARLDALEAAAASRAETAWVRALRLRNTGDWRIARDEERLTLLERTEEFRALVEGQDDTAALAWLDRGRPEAIPDWGRIALSASGLSVETVNRFADLSIAMELAEAGEVLTALRGAPADEVAFLEAMNERPGRLVTRGAAGQAPLAVLGWGLWADRAQRHLLYDLAVGSYSRAQLLGQPGEAHAFAERSRERFGRLDLYAVVLRGHARDAEQYRKAMAAVRELAIRSPERLTGGHWQLFRAKEDFAPVPRDLPDENTWFRPALPPGTLLDVERRLAVLRELQALGGEGMGALRALAPRNVALAHLAASRQPGARRSVADLVPVYGPLADFNVGVMGKLADAAWYDPAGFRERQGALCEVVPEKCFLLGYRLAEMGFPDEAALAYQKGFERANDRVCASNEGRWLVDYYLDHGQARKAEAVAREAAAVYSEQGLFAMAHFMERMGRLPEAEEHYRRILDRYDRADALVGFYYRQARARKNAAYEPKLRDALALALPSGLQPLDRGALPSPPADGVVVQGENDNTRRCGIKWGHVVVGLDGFRVPDLRAYEVALALSPSPHLKLVVWRGKSYDDVEVDLWDRQFRVEMETLAPKK
jgi:hypothetical protein